MLLSTKIFRRPPASRPCLVLLALALLLAFSASAARAQSAKIFVASYGNDVNAGTSVSPKRNFQAAHDAVAAGGEIVVLDTAGYGALSITKSISLVVPAGVNGFITVSGGNDGIDIDAAATDVVSLQGLIIEGGGADHAGNGIFVRSVGTVRVQDCTIRNFEEGILVGVNSISSHLSMSGCSVHGTQYGIDLYAFESGSVDAAVTACSVDGTSQVGIEGYSDATNTKIVVSETTVTHCNHYGLFADDGATLLADHDTVTGNGTGIAPFGSSLSFGNNTFADNGTNGTFSGTVTKK